MKIRLFHFAIYRGDSFETVEIVTKGKEITTSKVAGHRTGDCPK